MTLDNGVELLIHIGLETVVLNGTGFALLGVSKILINLEYN